jgi:Outer membrane protein beta-barrel domain
MFKLNVLLVIAFAFSAGTANALEVSVVGAYGMSNVNISNTTGTASASSSSNGTSFGGGVLLAGSLAPMFQLEVGALYLPRTITASDNSGDSLNTTFNTLQVPVVLRLSPAPILSLGVGGYFAEGLGSVSQTATSGGVSQTSTESYSAANWSATDFGLLGSIRLGAPVAPLVKLFVDGRYVMGLKNLDTTNDTTTHAKDIQILAGVSFGM